MKHKFIKETFTSFIFKSELCVISPDEIKMSEFNKIYTHNDDDVCDSSNDINSGEEQNVANSDSELESDIEQDQEDDVDDIIENLFIVSSGSLGRKPFIHINITKTSPFLLISDKEGNIPVIIKLTSLWLNSSINMKISSDRLHRVQTT